MKIQVAKQDLEAALQVVSPSLAGSGNASDISTHFLFRVVPQSDNSDSWDAEVLTYTGQLCAKAPFISRVEIDSAEVTSFSTRKFWPSFSIEGKRLKALLRVVSQAALTFDHDGTVTTVTTPRGPQVFQSLDPKKYPYWDQTLTSAKLVATVPASGLRRAFSWARLFVSEEESRRPDLCVFESKKGTIFATNQRGAALVTVPSMEKSTLRVHGKEAAALIGFLDTIADGDVEVLECDRALYLRRSDGAVFGEYRHNVTFPDNLKMGQITSDPQWWEVPVQDLDQSIQFLKSGADDKDNRLRFKEGPNGSVTLEMARVFGDTHAVQSVPCESGSEEEAPPLQKGGFLLDHIELKKVLAINEDETLRFGVHQRKRSGFVRFSFSNDGIGCQVIIAWLGE